MKKAKYPIHRDFKMWRNMKTPLGRTFLPLIQKTLRILFLAESSSARLKTEKITIPSSDGANIRALLYTPADISENSPCLLYYHGGGFIFPAAPHQYKLAREYALRAKCRVLFLDYRLAPEYPFPIPAEDCFAAYKWVSENADMLSADRSRIAVAGDSAGGELAAVVCLMARDRGVTAPCAQMMIYPVTGRNTGTESMKKYGDTPMCSSRDIEIYDKYYIQDVSAGKPEYCSPLGAETLSGLPAAYIETAEFDCLRDEGILYAVRLRESGVEAELHNTVGTMHGFDIVSKSPIVRKCVDDRVAFLRKAFSFIDEK